MSRTNLEVIRALFEAWGRGEVEEFLREHFELSARLDLSENVFNPAVYDGYEDIARQRREVGDVWELFEIEVEQFFEGEDVVVAFTRERGQGRASGVAVDRNTAFVFRLRRGKVREARAYRDRDQALADAGLSSARPSPDS